MCSHTLVNKCLRYVEICSEFCQFKLCVLEIRNLLSKDISLFNKLQRQVKRQLSLRKVLAGTDQAFLSSPSIK